MIYTVFALVFILAAVVCYLVAMLVGGDPEGRGADTMRRLLAVAGGFVAALLIDLCLAARHSRAAAVILGAVLAILLALALRWYWSDLVAAARRWRGAAAAAVSRRFGGR